MSSVVIAGDTSGTVTLAAPAVAGTTTLTLPTTSGTVLTSANAFSAGTGPAFIANISANQNISSSVWTKVMFNSEIADTNSCYDSTTNYRFTPTVAGYYQINIEVLYAATSGGGSYGAAIYVNGTPYLYGFRYAGGVATGASSNVEALILCNGTTDYIEAYALYAGTSPYFAGVPNQTHFSAFLARAA